MLKLRVGKGRQVMKQLCLNTALQYVATERAGYVLYRALVESMSLPESIHDMARARLGYGLTCFTPLEQLCFSFFGFMGSKAV